jgi:hypothetical protein
MTTIRQMLPQSAQPYTEAIVGAGLGALVSKFWFKDSQWSTGAVVGFIAGYGIALTRAKGAFPFTATAGGFYAGDSVTQFPTQQQGYAQPYGGLGQGVEFLEEAAPEVVPEYGWPRRRDDWWRRGGGGYGRGGWGHGWRRWNGLLIVSFVGRGRIVTEERVEFCGTRVLWYVVLFTDDAVGRERAAGRSVDLSYANAIKARWEKETCIELDAAPVKYSATGLNAARKKPKGRDLRTKKISNTDSVVTSNWKE